MLSIGEFARLVGVSVRMLRHYDRLGLLAPARVDPQSGYRSYSSSQLTRANELVALKDLGFALEQVGALLAGDADGTRVRTLLEARRAELRAQVALDTQRLHRVEAKLRLFERGTMMTEYTEQALAPLTLVQLSATVADMAEIEDQVGPLFDRVNGLIDEAGAERVGPGVATYTLIDERMHVGVGEQVGDVATPAGLERVSVGAEARAIVTTLEAPDLSDIQAAWQGLVEEVERRGLTPSGTCREVYRATPFDGPDAPGWVVDLQQPVA